MAYGLAPNPS